MPHGAPAPQLSCGDLDLGYALDDFDWKEALLRLLRDPELRHSMGASGRKRAVDSYSVESVVPKYLEIFQRVS